MPTEPKRLQQWLEQLPASHKSLATQEGPLTQWMRWQLREKVNRLIVCNPKTGSLAPPARHYLAMRRHQVRLKQQVKALFRRWGILRVEGETIYSLHGRQNYLPQVEDSLIRRQLGSYYTMMDEAVGAQNAAEARGYQMGKKHPEIIEFQQMPGIGPVGAQVLQCHRPNPAPLREC